jgi:hypothetical protein
MRKRRRFAQARAAVGWVRVSRGALPEEGAASGGERAAMRLNVLTGMERMVRIKQFQI